MRPYFEQRGIQVYHGDCRDMLPTLDTRNVLVLTDPPYGISLDTANHSRGRSSRPFHASGSRPNRAVVLASDYPPIYGDDQPYDPSPLLRFPRLVLFGANHFASRLPESPSWLIWDKISGLTSGRAIGFNDNADAELIWTNLGGPVRILRHQWIGMMKMSERGVARVHPTQKPVLLMRWLIEMFARPDDLILDPYMGAGSTLIAAMSLGRQAIGIEYERAYCEIAVSRLRDPPLIEALMADRVEQPGLWGDV